MGGSGFNRHAAGKWVRFQPALTRLLAPIGYIPPARAEERYYASLDQPAMAAQLGPVEIWDSQLGLFVIQALDGSLCID